MEFALDQYHEIPDDHLAKVCKYRHGNECCRYIVFFEKPGRFYCVKNIKDLKGKIDSEISDMKAQGDNCEGLQNEAG